jgi:hypothetical protein
MYCRGEYESGAAVVSVPSPLIPPGLGAGIDLVDKHGNTALHYAVGYDERSCMAELLMEGSDDTIVNDIGVSAFDMAMQEMGKGMRPQPYGNHEAWEAMKTRVPSSQIHPPFISRKSEEYTSFATGVSRAFSSLPEAEREEGKDFDFLLPFVNAGRSVPSRG